MAIWGPARNAARVIPLPPYAELLKLRVEHQDDGTLYVMPFGDDVVGRPGFLHGGAIAGLLEVAAFGTLSHALEGLGFGGVQDVRAGKLIELELADGTTDADIEAMCRKLLANTVIENFRIERMEAASA